MIELFFFFFFQAEDGIRDKLVTGVQTCALPISRCVRTSEVKLLPPAPTLPVNLHRLNPHRPLATSKRATARGAVVRERGRRELWRDRRMGRPPAACRRAPARLILAPPRLARRPSPRRSC